jgi:hypothetical protein
MNNKRNSFKGDFFWFNNHLQIIKILIIVIFLMSNHFVYSQKSCEKWKVYEISLKGTTSGNPFIDVEFSATFSLHGVPKSIKGFYDGNGIYKVRFMPDKEGRWTYVTQSNQRVLNGKKGEFLCTPPATGNRGPVIVKDTFNLAYADGTPHYSFGTTSYAWVHQGDSLAEVTLQTLSNGYFNKLRMCVFPKSYNWNKNEPLYYPFEGMPLTEWDYSRFNPEYFRNIEKRIAQLDSLGVQADIIVFHPYDRWGLNNMEKEVDDRYMLYIIARFAAYKNVWWSMANEFEYIRAKKTEDWDRIIEFFAANDPYQRLRGIHNGRKWYDHHNPLITHLSIQSGDTQDALKHRNTFRKPAIFDECLYEGNLPMGWGNISAQTMVDKFWLGFMNGGHVGHSEAYLTETPVKLPEDSDDITWWSKGGELNGQSHSRIKFLREIIESAPVGFRSDPPQRSILPAKLVKEGEYYLFYFGNTQPSYQVIGLPKGKSYRAEVIDVWNMTITPLPEIFQGRSLIELPGKPMTALRIKSIN